MEGNLYRSVLHTLSELPEAYLPQVNLFLQVLQKKVKAKEQNRQEILGFAGSWADMSEEDFHSLLANSKKEGNELFSREVDL